jgi:hypothetical protein
MKKDIAVAFTGGSGITLSNIWTVRSGVTKAMNGFYIEPFERDAQGAVQNGVVHISLHGPNSQNSGHRFQIKFNFTRPSDPDLFVWHSVPSEGTPFDGEEVAPGVYRVLRLRWTGQLARYPEVAANRVKLPDHNDAEHLVVLADPLAHDQVGDLDLFFSYHEAYWPDPEASLRDNARLLPLFNTGGGTWFTGTTYRRPAEYRPAPEGMLPALPAEDETPAVYWKGGLGDEQFYWIVQSITARHLIRPPA